MNERYSSLNQITTGNVGTLKQAWSTHLDGSGMAGKYSAEATPLVYNGTMFIVTGNDDIFALDATTGAHLWTYHSGIFQNIDTICCGWDARGVALGDGKIFVAQLDGNLVADRSDDRWGRVVAPERQLAGGLQPDRVGGVLRRQGLHGHDGRRVRRPRLDDRVRRHDGRTGLALLHLPAARRFRRRHLGLRRVGDLRCHDLEQPVVRPGDRDDVLLDLERRSVGRDVSPGTNLFSSSFVALDYRTGQFRWYYQAVHHDLWDYDCPSPTMLFDVTTSDGGPAPRAHRGVQDGLPLHPRPDDREADSRRSIRSRRRRSRSSRRTTPGRRSRPRTASSLRSARWPRTGRARRALTASRTRSAASGPQQLQQLHRELTERGRRRQLAADQLQPADSSTSTSARATPPWP